LSVTLHPGTPAQRTPRAGNPLHRGSRAPGADDDPFFDREEPFDGSFPGADDDPFFDSEDPFDGSFPGADDPFFDAVLWVAARLLEPPAPISATVARTASDFVPLLMFFSLCVVIACSPAPLPSVAGHRCIRESCVGRSTWPGDRERWPPGAACNAKARWRRWHSQYAAPCSDSHATAPEGPMSTASPVTCADVSARSPIGSLPLST
jgi:hypothetical protein